MEIEIQRYTWDYLDSNMYVIKNRSNALVIDPIDNEKAFDFLKECNDITVLLTHEHYDHINGLNRLRKEHCCKVIAQEQCSLHIQDKKKNLSAFANVLNEITSNTLNNSLSPFICCGAEITFSNQYSFQWGDMQINLVSTPGHSFGSACILFNDALFSGDSLLEKGPMNRFPGGNSKVFRTKTIPILKELLSRVSVVYPGHGDWFRPQNVGWIRTNIFLYDYTERVIQ